jgi:spermidine synthase
MKKSHLFLFIVIIVSSYVGLALEIVAMRQIVSFVGGDVIISSIIIGIVLLFSSFGYYKSTKINLAHESIRQKLLYNFTISTIFLLLGTTLIFCDHIFGIFRYLHIGERIAQTFLYSIFMLGIPSSLLSQTTPLISNYFIKYNKKIAGKVLALGTIGSFLGSIVSTLIIMPFFGVNNTTIFNLFLMLTLVLFLDKKNKYKLIAATIFLVGYFFNSSFYEKRLGILSNNEYSMIRIHHNQLADTKIMLINNSFSSKIAKNEDNMFEYYKYINENFIKNLPQNLEDGNKKTIAVVGAGGFTMGHEDNYNDWDYIDVDKNLKPISEKYFLEKELGENKYFIIQDARHYFKENTKKYDLIILDTYSSRTEIPSQLITAEYFVDVKNRLNENGIIVMNIISSPTFNDDFSVKIDNTIRFVYNNIQRQVIGNINPYLEQGYTNNIYVYYNTQNNRNIYTDNKNSSMFDK